MPKTMKQMKAIFKKYLQRRRSAHAREVRVVVQELMAAVRRAAEAHQAEEDRQALRYALHAQRMEEARARVASNSEHWQRLLGPASPSNSDDYGPIEGENYEPDERGSHGV